MRAYRAAGRPMHDRVRPARRAGRLVVLEKVAERKRLRPASGGIMVVELATGKERFRNNFGVEGAFISPDNEILAAGSREKQR